MLKAVREAEDGEYISVIDDEDHVRVAKEKKRLVIRVTEKQKKGKDNRVDIQIPIAVVEALLSGKDDREASSILSPRWKSLADMTPASSLP